MSDDVIFQEAVDALRNGDRAKARELLTGLLKTDQNNTTYWIWMSALMDTAKERIYCLQTAFKLDPENATAKRGLILHGALPADETVQPFPLNRPRAWEEKLLLAHEKPKPKGWEAVKASPVFRLGLAILLIGGLAAGILFGLVLPRMNQVSQLPTNTPGPSPTYTATPTFSNSTGQPAIVGTVGPLSELLEVPYTATPLYVNTPRPPQSNDIYRAMKPAYEKGDWDEVIRLSNEVLRVEPDAADVYYYLGEAYRFKGDPGQAMAAYESALGLNKDFGAAYVGLARARLLADPGANVLPLLEEAVRLDPNFGEAYLERAKVKLRDNDNQGALKDLSEANSRMSNSPLVFYNLALAQQKEGAIELALQAAQRANQLDVTDLPTYLLLGQLHAETGNYEEANRALDIYLRYAEGDASAFLLLGKMQFNQGRYAEAIREMEKVIELDRGRREAYLYRFLSNVELGDGDAADEDIDRMISFYPDSFDANIAIARLHYIKERFGSAELAVTKTESLAESDEQKALVYFWSGLVYEKREKPKDAADYWQKLLELPEDAMSAEMRAEAQKRFFAIRTPTPTVTPGGRTATPTRTPTPTQTPSPTATK